MKRWISILLSFLILIALSACETSQIEYIMDDMLEKYIDDKIDDKLEEMIDPTRGTPLHEPRKSSVLRFSKVDDVDFPPYEGEVQVLTQSDNPPRISVLVGSVYVAENMSIDEILTIMKEEAAMNGADTIILFYDEPEIRKSGDLFWSAKAIKTQEVPGPT